MESEPITIYSLLVGVTGNWTLQDASNALQNFPDVELIQAMGLVSRFGLAFHLAFGDDDIRARRVLGGMGVLGNELQRRGVDGLQLNLDMAWQGWCRVAREALPESQNIPTHRIAELREAALEAIPRLGNGTDAVAAKQALNEAAQAIASLLTHRGYSGIFDSGATSQA